MFEMYNNMVHLVKSQIYFLGIAQRRTVKMTIRAFKELQSISAGFWRNINWKPQPEFSLLSLFIISLGHFILFQMSENHPWLEMHGILACHIQKPPL